MPLVSAPNHSWASATRVTAIGFLSSYSFYYYSPHSKERASEREKAANGDWAWLRWRKESYQWPIRRREWKNRVNATTRPRPWRREESMLPSLIWSALVNDALAAFFFSFCGNLNFCYVFDPLGWFVSCDSLSCSLRHGIDSVFFFLLNFFPFTFWLEPGMGRREGLFW